MSLKGTQREEDKVNQKIFFFQGKKKVYEREEPFFFGRKRVENGSLFIPSLIHSCDKGSKDRGRCLCTMILSSEMNE